jgi:HAE1 family hydrophobic/amphiphilic exporter-1
MVNGIIKFSLNNKFAVWLLTIIVTAAGLYSGLTMKQELLPELEVPIISVTTIYPGASPEEVLEGVTKPLEQSLRYLDGVKSVTSTSMENASNLILEYDYGQNMDFAIMDVREALKNISLPDSASDPSLSRLSMNMLPVLAVSIADENRPLEDLTRLVEEQIVPELQGLDGVASVQIAGQYVREVELRWNEQRMRELGITEETVQGIIRASALRAPLGLFEMENSEKAVVVDGNILTLEDLKQLAIPVVPSQAPQGAGPQGLPSGQPSAGMGGATQGDQAPAADAGDAQLMPETNAGSAAQGAQAPAGFDPSSAASFGIPTVQLQEIADIEVIGRAESISRTNGSASIGLQIIKAPDANTVEVVDRVKEKSAEFAERYEGLDIVHLFDQGEPIVQSVATMLDKALYGSIFAVIVILLFLRNIRTTIISIISIPLSLLIGILLLHQMDISLNMMTLGAMTVAIGRVVDDSIVVIENIYRRLSLKNEPLKGKELIRSATREMFIPIMSSTIVTIAVYVPLAAVSGMVGELFIPFALTMVFALLASLLVAVTLVPALGHTMFRKGIREDRRHDAEHPGKLASGYRKLLNWALNHKAISMLAAVALLVASLFLIPVIGASFLPEEEQKYAMITYSPSPGVLLEEVEQTALEAEKLILSEQDVINLQYSVGGSNPLSPGQSKSALFFVQYDNDVKHFSEIKTQLLEKLRREVPGSGEWNLLDFAAGLGGSNMSLLVYGDSLESIQSATQQIEELMKSDPAFDKVESSLSEAYDQYTLVADQQKLSSLGLTAGQIVMALNPVREQPVLTEIAVDGKKVEVKVKADQNTFTSIEEIRNHALQSPLGIPVPLKDVVEVREGKTPDTLTMKDGRLYAEITAEVKAKDVAGASSALESKIDALNLPPEITVDFGGVTEQITETFTQLGLAMLAAIAIVYFVLVVTFHGALAPFVILFSLPFAVIGALVGLWLAGETLNVSALMGALMLIGIVVTNAIVLIDRVIRKEAEGLSTREALLEAGATRLRPILMTAFATVGALLPLAFGNEDSGMITRGLGITVIGGLTSSTLLTLVIVPIVYELLMRFRIKKPSAAEE